MALATRDAFQTMGRDAEKWAVAQTEPTREWTTVDIAIPHALGWVFFVIGLVLAGFWMLWGLALLTVAIPLLVVPIRIDHARAVRTELTTQYPDQLHLVCAFVRARVDTAEQEAIGNAAPMTILTARLEQSHAAACALQQKIHERTATVAATHILQKEDADTADATVALLTENLARLRTHTDMLRAFFVAARQHIDALLDPASDLSLKRELVQLHAAAQTAAHDVDAVLATSMVGVHSALERTRGDLRNLIEETGVAVAMELPASGDAATDIAAIEKALAVYLERANALDLTLNLPTTGGVQ
ncbi:hypothetical protein HY632_01195 [Candidatus Uhrbacteria bacterium]|nr:hypothetical protein [Candidatus Uhrbacteria bacterium]